MDRATPKRPAGAASTRTEAATAKGKATRATPEYKAAMASRKAGRAAIAKRTAARQKLERAAAGKPSGPPIEGRAAPPKPAPRGTRASGTSPRQTGTNPRTVAARAREAAKRAGTKAEQSPMQKLLNKAANTRSEAPEPKRVTEAEGAAAKERITKRAGAIRARGKTLGEKIADKAKKARAREE
jgi:hypothetical protein